MREAAEEKPDLVVKRDTSTTDTIKRLLADPAVASVQH
jgi:hypothetical protein